MQKKVNDSLELFLDFFPVVELPVTITEESQRAFERENEVLSQPLIEKFLLLETEDNQEEFTEYIPCFKVPETAGIHAVVYWRARLMEYEFFLLTLDKEGNHLDQKRIAGLFSNNDKLLRMVSTIDRDWIIHVIIGESSLDDETFDPSSTMDFSFELLATGEIIQS